MIVIIVLICSLALGHVIAWVYTSHMYYDRCIFPGEVYHVGETQYMLPDLPLHGSAYVLEASYLQKQHDFLTLVGALLSETKLEWWLSGGTLLGFVRHGTFIPWDDDCDIHTHWCNQNVLFSDEFFQKATGMGLETIFLPATSTQFATKEGASVRLRRCGTYMPVCDIFFVHSEDGDKTFAKIDSWNKGRLAYSRKERWDVKTLFPIHKKNVDGMCLNFPNEPVNTLIQQYGPNVMKKMFVRSRWFSHAFPYIALNWIWKRRPREPPRMSCERSGSYTSRNPQM